MRFVLNAIASRHLGKPGAVCNTLTSSCYSWAHDVRLLQNGFRIEKIVLVSQAMTWRQAPGEWKAEATSQAPVFMAATSSVNPLHTPVSLTDPVSSGGDSRFGLRQPAAVAEDSAPPSASEPPDRGSVMSSKLQGDSRQQAGSAKRQQGCRSPCGEACHADDTQPMDGLAHGVHFNSLIAISGQLTPPLRYGHDTGHPIQRVLGATVTAHLPCRGMGRSRQKMDKIRGDLRGATFSCFCTEPVLLFRSQTPFRSGGGLHTGRLLSGRRDRSCCAADPKPGRSGGCWRVSGCVVAGSSHGFALGLSAEDDSGFF